MKWSYKTVHFELKKEGLLGGAFLDEAEIEEQLNAYGRSGWELISVIEVQDGIIAFFKQSLTLNLTTIAAAQDESEADDADAEEQLFGPAGQHPPYTAARNEPERYMAADDTVFDQDNEESDELYMVEETQQTDVGQVLSAEPEEGACNDHDHQRDAEEAVQDHTYSGIGAIKIE